MFVVWGAFHHSCVSPLPNISHRALGSKNSVPGQTMQSRFEIIVSIEISISPRFCCLRCPLGVQKKVRTKSSTQDRPLKTSSPKAAIESFNVRALFRRRPPGLFLLVLTVLGFWSRVLLVPGFQLLLRVPDCAHELAFAS